MENITEDILTAFSFLQAAVDYSNVVNNFLLQGVSKCDSSSYLTDADIRTKDDKNKVAVSNENDWIDRKSVV